jgi:hypothetical protein
MIFRETLGTNARERYIMVFAVQQRIDWPHHECIKVVRVNCTFFQSVKSLCIWQGADF